VSAIEELIPRFDTAFDALERGDVEAFVEISNEIADPRVEFHSAIGSAVGGGTYKGIDGIGSWFRDLLETAEQARYRERRYETIEDRILLMLATFEMTGVASKVPVSSEVGTVFEFEHGRCVRITSFTSHAEARELVEALTSRSGAKASSDAGA
jgi:hypothetical protein